MSNYSTEDLVLATARAFPGEVALSVIASELAGYGAEGADAFRQVARLRGASQREIGDTLLSARDSSGTGAIEAEFDKMALELFGEEGEASSGEEQKPDDWAQEAEVISAIARDMEALTPREQRSLPPLMDDKGTYNLLSLDDIDSMPDVRFLIDRMIPERGVGVIYGDSRSKKTFIGLDMCLHLVSGRSAYHGDKISAADSGSVLYLAGEGAGGFKLRIPAWKAQNPGAVLDADRFRLLPHCPNFLDPKNVSALIKTIDGKMDGVKVLVIDTLARALVGADENASKDLGPFFVAVDNIVRKYNCVVIILHHTSKAGEMRGSTAIMGAVDFAFRLTSKPGSLDVSVFCDKMKDGGADGWEEIYEMREHEVGVNVDGKVLTSLAVATKRPATEDDEPETAKRGGAKRGRPSRAVSVPKREDPGEGPKEDVLRYVRSCYESGAPIPTRDGEKHAAKGAGVKASVAYQALQALIREGAVVRVTKGRENFYEPA